MHSSKSLVIIAYVPIESELEVVITNFYTNMVPQDAASLVADILE